MRILHAVVGALLGALCTGVHGFAGAPCIKDAFLDVPPGVIRLGQPAKVLVYDHFGPSVFNSEYAVATHVSTAANGTIFTVTATLADTNVVAQRGPFVVDLGELPVGRYTVEYDGGDQLVCPLMHKAQFEFFVSAMGLSKAVEFFNAALGHYFLATDPVEIARLDSGELRGWTRTGESFMVYPPTAMPTRSNPVCRFYGLPDAGIDSHFFSDDVNECAAVSDRWPGAWIEETSVAFGTKQGGGSVCADAYTPVYRLYNNRQDANHRYTVSTDTRDQMRSQGWLEEGRYPNDVGGVAYAMCVPR